MIDRNGTTQWLRTTAAGAALVLAVSGCTGAAPSVTPSWGPPQPSTTASAPTLVPVMRSISGTATVETTGEPVPGVQIRGTTYDPQGEPSSPESTAVTDERGAYTLSFPTWPRGNLPVCP